METTKQKFIIVGGGPVGFAAALLLAKQGYPSEVYEGRPSIPDDPQESYPIGVNPRGLHTLSLIDPGLCDKLKSVGTRVDSWQIFVGPRRVGISQSGVTFGTSRARLNRMLADAALAEPLIEVTFGHRLSAIDFDARTLTFELSEGSSGTVTIDADNARIIAADGVNSRVRQLLQAHDPTFKSEVIPWTYEFRVMFGVQGIQSEALDEHIHYIHNGQYLATVDYDGSPQWSCVTCVRDRAPEARRALFLSKDASQTNIAALRNTLKELVPTFSVLVPETAEGDAEIARYFGRRTFRGAIVRTSRLHHEEWLVLVGDAAHSVLPPTGEGLNSGLEDAAVLVNMCICNNPTTAFSDYNATRYKDIQALLNYATYLNEDPDFAGERIARVLFLIAGSMKKPSTTDYLFGPLSAQRKPYHEFLGEWNQRRKRLLSLFRVITYPIGIVVELLKRLFGTRRRSRQ
jgi:kynurenine 3-monooxygenase